MLVVQWFVMMLFLTLVPGVGLMLSSVPAAVAQTTEGGYRIFRPSGVGPHPAVVFVSGCSGFSPAFAPKAYERPAEQLRGLGFVVVWADYLGRRNLTTCTAGITPHEAGEDAVAAASWLRSQPEIDAKRITAVGWSYGGAAVLAALGRHSAEQVILTRAIVFYPYCADIGPWSQRTPVLALWGNADNVAPQRLCKSTLEASAARGADIKIVDYPGAQHGFDNAALPPKMEYPFGTLGYHPQAAAEAWEEVTRFLGVTR